MKFVTKCKIAIFLIQTKKIDNFLLGYGMQQNEGVMGNVIVNVVNAGDLRGEEYWLQQPQNIAGNMDTLRGGMNTIHL